MIKQLLSVVCISLIAGIFSNAFAWSIQRELDGYYVPIVGQAQTQEVFRPWLGESPTQIGKYRLILRRKGWHQLSRLERSKTQRILFLRGIIKGVVDEETFTLDHVFTLNDRSGAMYSENDVFIPESGDPYCSQGAPMIGKEIINVSVGTGKFENLSGGTLQVRGTVHNCPNLPEFLKNDFEVIKGAGGLCFGICDELGG